MKARDLIAELQKLPPDTEVIVWEGYNAGFATEDIELCHGTFNGKPFVRLEWNGQ